MQKKLSGKFCVMYALVLQIQFSRHLGKGPGSGQGSRVFYQVFRRFSLFDKVTREVKVKISVNLLIYCWKLKIGFFRFQSRFQFLGLHFSVRLPLSSTQTPSVQYIGSTQGPHLFSTKIPQFNTKNPSVPYRKPLSSTPKTSQFNT